MELANTQKMEELTGKKQLESLEDLPKVYLAIKDSTKTNFKQSKDNNAIFLEK